MCKPTNRSNEDILIDKYPTLKIHESGIFELVIENYCIKLQTQEQGNSVVLIRDDIDLNIPNKFDIENRDEALIFYMFVINTVIEKVQNDSNTKEDIDTQKRFKSGELVPALILTNNKYYRFINDKLLCIRVR